MKKIFCISLFFLLAFCFCNAQNTDSLLSVFKNEHLPDSIRLRSIDDVAWNYVYSNLDTAILLAQQELTFADAHPSDKTSLWKSKAYGTMGAASMAKGFYPKALGYFLKVLKIREELKDSSGIGRSYTNIAELYRAQLNYSLALQNDLKALNLFERIGDKSGMGYCNNNIGLIYLNQNNSEKAYGYFEKGLKLMEELGDVHEIGNDYLYLGLIDYQMDKDKEALDYYLKAFPIKRRMNDAQGLAGVFLDMNLLYYKMQDYKKAILYCDSVLQIVKETGNINQERDAYESLSNAYQKTGKYQEAYEYHVKFKTIVDSIFNADNSKQLGDLKTKYEVDKKESELKAEAAAQQIIAAEEKKRQEVIMYSVAGVLLLVIVFSLFLLNRFQITKKQKQVIEEQKILVDKAYVELNIKNNEVMDSIYYARRIQRSLITSEKYIEKNINRLRNRN